MRLSLNTIYDGLQVVSSIKPRKTEIGLGLFDLKFDLGWVKFQEFEIDRLQIQLHAQFAFRDGKRIRSGSRHGCIGGNLDWLFANQAGDRLATIRAFDELVFFACRIRAAGGENHDSPKTKEAGIRTIIIGQRKYCKLNSGCWAFFLPRLTGRGLLECREPNPE